MEQENPNPHTTIDMEAVAKDLEEMMHGPGVGSLGNGAAVPTEYHISIVKRNIRDVDPWQYKPIAVSVGPNHHDATKRMEKVKLAKLLDALPGERQKRLSVLEDYLNAISGLLRDVRPYYGDGASSWDDNKLSRILLVDGFYILHVFGVGSFGGGDGLGAEDSIEHIRDVFYLLENQIPFFVLVKIYDLFFPQTDGVGSSAATVTVLLQGLENSVRPLLKNLGYLLLEETDGVPPHGDSPWHLLHMLYTHFKPTAMSDVTPATVRVEKISRTAPSLLSRLGIRIKPAATPADLVAGGDDTPHPVYRWRGATQYHAAGVRFERRVLDCSKQVRCLLDVELRGLATVYIPTLTVDNNTWRFLRNMMALEQQSPRLGVHVTAYCLFMSHLAGTAKDVDLLVRKGIMVHFMGCDEDVAQGFADLCKGVSNNTSRIYLHTTWEKMEQRYSSRPINWIKLMQRKHLSNPALAFTLLITMISFVCTVVQTVYAVKSYKAAKYQI